MADVQYADLRHDCPLPNMEHLPRHGERNQVMAHWKCPECGSRWAYTAAFLHYDRMFWSLVGKPRRRWRRDEAKRLAAMSTSPAGGAS